MDANSGDRGRRSCYGRKRGLLRRVGRAGGPARGAVLRRLWAAVGWEWLRFEAKHERAKGPDTEGPREYPLARINR
jgi:hypothetical protein